MIVIDTNVLLRMFVDDDPTQHAEVRALVERVTPANAFYVSTVTLVELLWVLRIKKYTRAQTIDILDRMLEADDFVVGQRQAVVQALAWYRAGKADFADYLIHADGAAAGAKTLVTFDDAFAKEDTKRRKHPRRWKA